MIPGPAVIRNCPGCDGLMRQATTLSGNTFGATYWTDGAMYAPMLPREEPVVKCPHCGRLHWIEDLKEVDSIPQCPGWLMYYDEHEDVELSRKLELYSGVPGYEVPTPEEMIAFADSGIHEERELHVRVRAWQQFNNQRRGARAPIGRMTDSQAVNVARIALILEGRHDSQSRLLRGEALRELGRFEDARRIIEDGTFDNAEREIARFLLQLIGARDMEVRKLPGAEEVST